MSEFVTWYDSTQAGAPVLNNVAGSLIAVLDACLVTGFNTKPITSITVAAGVATVVCNGHGYSAKYSQDIDVAGATPGALNGRKQLTYTDTNTFKFLAPGVSDQTATGTITAKVSPLGWLKQFTGTNKAIYKRSDVTATSMMLRIVDTATTPAATTDVRAQMIETATDIDTFTGVSPSAAQVSDGFGMWWGKGTSNTTAKQWSLVGDGMLFILLTQNGSTILPTGDNSAGASQAGFGDFTSLKQGDAYNCLLLGGSTLSSGNYVSAGGIAMSFGYAPAPVISAGLVCARSYSQGGGAVLMNNVSLNVLSGGGSMPVYPSPVDGGVTIQPGVLLNESNTLQGHPFRGVLNGVHSVLSRYPYPHLFIESAVPSLQGRTCISMSITSQYGTGSVMVDLTGPWA
jgi:hypothetical protein